MRATTTDENPRPWRFRDALKEKAGLRDEEIDKLFATSDHLDLVELGMGLEEAYGIEILDEDLLIPPDEQEGHPQS
jgi:acyl carrier protein